ncbi:hypothetical protein K1T73_16960 [Roseovarius sp. SCSIO 43702]|uniref:hypothetical protein n=1 Tax=Roseovarius sp. SCSIO 43702 TaxID=2823043 RepID=UPI001C72BEC7|nr:hypothetical protein [Roseovarius sp. SCSIO 43702]QYX56699.1 hypothetical protein K1T73_16960 [Roseovarius sp. SCSIO 43702]
MGSLRFLARAPWVMSLGLALTPAIFAVGPWIESRAFPVTRDTVIRQPHTTGAGVSLFVSFRKVRQCEFLSLAWYRGPVRHIVDFEPTAEQAPRTRPSGEQLAGPWLIRDLASLSGSRAIAYHRCHPLWITVTEFYNA